MKILNKATLLERSETTVALVLASKAEGHEVGVRVRRISAVEYNRLLAPPPPDWDSWPPAEREARERAWLEGLPRAERDARRVEFFEVICRLIERCALEPTFTVEEARRLGDDALVLANGILEFSGLLPSAEAETAGAAPQEAATT